MARRHVTCTHRWMLGEPGFRLVRGVCRRCGARKAFPSGLEVLQIRPDYDQLDGSQPVFAPGPASEDEPVSIQGWRAVSLS